MGKPLTHFTIAIFLLIAGATCELTAGEERLAFDLASFTLGASMPDEASIDVDWQPVSLPDLWAENHPGYEGSIWYRINIPLGHQPEGLWAVYLPRLNMNAAVYVNGVMIGNGGRFTQPMARNWNRPLYFTVPVALWKTDDNQLLIRLQADKSCRGGLYPIQLGPDEQLRPGYERALFFQTGLLKILFVISLCISAGAAVLWLLRKRRDAMYGWYALGTFFWAVYIQYFFVRDITLSTHTWMWLTFSSAYGMIVAMMLFCQIYMGLRCRWCVWLMPTYALLCSVLLYVTPLAMMFTTIAFTFVGLLLFVLYVFGHLLRYIFEHRSLETATLGFGVLVNVAFGIHDILTLYLLWSPPSYLLHYGMPVMLLAMGVILVNRFIQVLNESERLNLELDDRVRAREEELGLLHEELRVVERRQVMLQERERIVEDLHDGMGGQLVAALSLLDKPEASALLRQALEDAMLDFRLVIDSLDEDSHDVSTLLGMLRLRLEPQLSACDIRLNWWLEDGPELYGFGSEYSLHILRIVQEALTNAIRHSGAGVIDVSIAAVKGQLIIQVNDHGGGLAGGIAGRGIAHMHKRATRIGAVLNIDSSSQGVSVCLTCRCDDAQLLE